jgi:hypothetical protein
MGLLLAGEGTVANLLLRRCGYTDQGGYTDQDEALANAHTK